MLFGKFAINIFVVVLIVFFFHDGEVIPDNDALGITYQSDANQKNTSQIQH